MSLNHSWNRIRSGFCALTEILRILPKCKIKLNDNTYFPKFIQIFIFFIELSPSQKFNGIKQIKVFFFYLKLFRSSERLRTNLANILGVTPGQIYSWLLNGPDRGNHCMLINLCFMWNINILAKSKINQTLPKFDLFQYSTEG